MPTSRSLIKHVAQPFIYAIESDEDGMILNALDITNEVTSGGFCLHMLPALGLSGRIDDVELLNRERESYEAYVADCANVHHLMADVVAAEKDHRRAAEASAMAESRFRSLKKDTELKAQRVHELLGKIVDRKPLPLFEQV